MTGRARKATTGTTKTATESGFRALPQTTAKPPSHVFDASDVALLFLTIVAITLSIVFIVLPQLGKDPRDLTMLVFDGSSQVTNNFVNAGAETALPTGVVITLVVTLCLVLGFIVYLIATKKLPEIKRLVPFLAIASFFVATGSLIRLYPSDWSNVVASAFVLIGCGLALWLVVMDFKILPWDRKMVDEEAKKMQTTGDGYEKLLELTQLIRKGQVSDEEITAKLKEV